MPAPETASEVTMQSEKPTNESELDMLRTALTARGIDWHPRNNVATLKAKLEDAADGVIKFDFMSNSPTH